MSLTQRYRLRTPSTGREQILEADVERTYVDRETGEPLEVLGKLLPLAPSPSNLPWAVENLRFCNWCEQLAQKDLNDCPTCGRRMDPLGS
jgi:hypothetical protein